MLRPGLKAVFIGLNPAPISVERGHYYQGRHGRLFWNRLSRHHITPQLPRGAEDDAAFQFGYGFADLVRRPTASAKDLTRGEKLAAVSDLGVRLSRTGDHPLVVFTYKEPWTLAEPHLIQTGYSVFRMPGPYTSRKVADAIMEQLKTALGIA
jgi:double-stranded uracil-DNA glycosylase